MDVQQLKTFVTAVEQGSFAAAARRLDLAPSKVSRTVAALEAELGVRLLQRTTRHLALTEAGSAYHARVRAALDALDQAADEARATREQVRGTVRLTATVAFGQALLLPLLPALHAQHPGLSLDLVLTNAVLDMVSEGIDLSIRLGPSNDSQLIGVRLAALRYRLCASPAFLRQHGTPRRPADMARCPCLRFEQPGKPSAWVFRDRHGADETVAVQGWLTASSALALHRAALDGLGAVLLAHWLVDEDIAAGRLVDLFPQHQVSAMGFDAATYLLYPSRSHVPRRVRAVVDFLKTRLTG